MTGICNLCLKEKKLIKKSHIISEFLYRQSGMYDDMGLWQVVADVSNKSLVTLLHFYFGGCWVKGFVSENFEDTILKSIIYILKINY